MRNYRFTRFAARLALLDLSIRAAALMRITWIADSPRDVVAQSSPAFAPQKRQVKLIGLVGRTAGVSSLIFATPAPWHSLRRMGSVIWISG